MLVLILPDGFRRGGSDARHERPGRGRRYGKKCGLVGSQSLDLRDFLRVQLEIKDFEILT
jgi:hypothetical protein